MWPISTAAQNHATDQHQWLSRSCGPGEAQSHSDTSQPHISRDQQPHVTRGTPCQEDQEDHLTTTEFYTASSLSTEHKCHTESLEGAAALTQTQFVPVAPGYKGFKSKACGLALQVPVEMLQLNGNSGSNLQVLP